MERERRLIRARRAIVGVAGHARALFGVGRVRRPSVFFFNFSEHAERRTPRARVGLGGTLKMRLAETFPTATPPIRSSPAAFAVGMRREVALKIDRRSGLSEPSSPAAPPDGWMPALTKGPSRVLSTPASDMMHEYRRGLDSAVRELQLAQKAITNMP